MNWWESGELELARPGSSDLDVLFAGDFSPVGRATNLCIRGEFASLFGDSIALLKEKDISVVNLECPLTGRHEPIIKDGPHLSAPPESAAALRFAGFDVAALANNHILDHGPGGLTDTINACHAVGLRTVGAAQTLAEAQEPLFLENRGKTIAIINVAESEFSIAGPATAGANRLDPVANHAEILQAKRRADMVFIVIHGGHEFYPLPSPRMVQTYRLFASLGVTAVIGHHPHVASGFEIFDGVPIFYSLGNFLFDTDLPVEMSWYQGYFVRLSVSGGRVSKIRFTPYEQCKEHAGIRLLREEEKLKYLASIARHCDTIQDPARLGESWEAFCRSNEYRYLSTVLRLGRVGRGFLKFGLGRLAAGPKDRLIGLLNLIRCEAHRDVLVQVLENSILNEGTQHAGRRTH